MKKSFLVAAFLVLSVAGVFADTPKTYRGTGSAAVLNITPQEAEQKARREAFQMMIEEAGVRVSTADLLANDAYLKYLVIQSDEHRIVNPQCEITKALEPGNDGGDQILHVKADCRGQLIRLNTAMVKPVVRLVPESSTPDCQTKHLNALTNAETFRRMEGYCLLIRAATDVYLSVFSAFEEHAVIRLNRLTRDESSIFLKKGDTFSSGRLMSDIEPGAEHSAEVFFIVVSEKPLLIDAVPYLGAAYEETLSKNAGIQALDAILTEQTAPANIRLMTLPYLIIRK